MGASRGAGAIERMSDGERQERPISLFYSYSHRDEELRLRLEDHLSVLRWNGLIKEWHDRNIDLGEEWAHEIDRNLASADIILLLVSASFIASRYCWSVEMAKALERHDRGEAKVIPVILRHCRWSSTPFAKLQAAPKDGKPVTSWSDQDEALNDVATRIVRLVNELRADRAASSPAAAPVAAIFAPSPSPPASPRKIADFEVFRDVDAPWCPEMVALPAGEFLMGSPEGEEDRDDFEGPQHFVTIGYRLALGRYPVTFAEYDRFCAATRREPARDEGWGRARRPVINVSWQDAQAYVAWLAEETGFPYRLPSEAEWEYACRAGTTTRYSFGDVIAPKQANYDRSNHRKTTEVGGYPADPWGLYDMRGNVWEWVEDVWHDTYQGAVCDGSAWTDNEGLKPYRERVVRGGSWDSSSGDLRSAFRGWNYPDGRSCDLGFRVARTLD